MDIVITDARGYLGRVAEIRRGIERKKRRIEMLREMATGTTMRLSDMPRSSSPNPQRMEGVLCKIADLEREIAEDMAILASVRDEITATLCELEDYREQRVLYDRYVRGLSWREVIAESEYSDRQLYRLHGSGIAHIEGILRKEAV